MGIIKTAVLDIIAGVKLLLLKMLFAVRAIRVLYIALGAGYGLMFFLYCYPQPTGFAAAGIGAVLAIASVTTPISKFQRTLLIPLAVFAFSLEGRAILRDNKEQERRSADTIKTILENNRVRTRAILSSEQAKFEGTTGRLQAILAETIRLSKKTNQSLNVSSELFANLTGRNSLAAVTPYPPWGATTGLGIQNLGAYPLTGVSVLHQDLRLGDLETSVGTIAAHKFRPIPGRITPLVAGGTAVEFFLISAQNGLHQEELELRPAKHTGWDYRYTINDLYVRNDTLKAKQLYKSKWMIYPD